MCIWTTLKKKVSPLCHLVKYKRVKWFVSLLQKKTCINVVTRFVHVSPLTKMILYKMEELEDLVHVHPDTLHFCIVN